MSTVDYVQARAEAIAQGATAKITIIDALIPHILSAGVSAEKLYRPGALLVLLLHVHAELIEEKAAALRVIEDACSIRREAKDLDVSNGK